MSFQVCPETPVLCVAGEGNEPSNFHHASLLHL